MDLDFTDLVLLIGTNPLPNYVVAKYFIINNSNLENIWMVCSERVLNQKSTKEYAEVLKELLEDSKHEFPELIIVSDVDSKSSIELGLEKIRNANNGVHLFFTCGTKAMRVYAYSYLKLNVKSSFSASYLSARDFKIKFNDGSASDNLRNEIKITFDELLKLHLFEKEQEEADKHMCFNDVVNEFQKLIQEDIISNFYLKDGCFQRDIVKLKDKELEKVFKILRDCKLLAQNKDIDKGFILGKLDNLKGEKEKDNFKKRIEILRKILRCEPNDEFLRIIKAFPKEYRLYTNGGFNMRIDKKDCIMAVKYMDGLWFETYVANLIKSKLGDKFDSMLLNQKPYKKTDIIAKNNFEIDIVLMKGYQLIGISCTTDGKKHLCKSKGFEIILRTKQIGGEEAKAILITRADNGTVKRLQSELVLSTGTIKENILVLGEDDWKEDRLVKKIKDFID